MAKVVKHTEVVSFEVVYNNWRGGSDPPGVTSDPCQAFRFSGCGAKIRNKLELCKQNSKKVAKLLDPLVLELKKDCSLHKKKVSATEDGHNAI